LGGQRGAREIKKKGEKEGKKKIYSDRRMFRTPSHPLPLKKREDPDKEQQNKEHWFCEAIQEPRDKGKRRREITLNSENIRGRGREPPR